MTDARRHSIRVRVYYEDTDAGGIVYHATYLRWMERARTEWLRSLGARHAPLAERAGLQFVVAEMAIRWLRPARLDELLVVDVAVIEARRATMRLAQRVLRPARDGCAPDDAVPQPDGDELLAQASVRCAVMDRTTGRPAALPRDLTDALGAR
jgi:acyl-CoA thioester hydrolase